MYRFFLKRLLDIIGAIMLLLFVLPFGILLCIVLYILFKKKPFFIQKRLGMNGVEFDIYKFKSMSDEKDQNGFLLPDKVRMNRFGEFLRKTSIDELPQLINVLKGDMSLVGPRPMLPHYMQLYNEFQKRRNEVKPGITGLSQVKGRNQLPWLKRFEYDVFYVKNISFFLDLNIIFRTFIILFRQGKKSEQSDRPTVEFEGNK
ncbi:sugar transferase [Flavobacterium columnare]|uniref:Sugar transferase n=2 Tax=Flavobacterium columnare TaxID=996 RepID=A0AAI8CJU9_9FLAO|nr:sugar transferase [Flavobacterium columnare]AMO21164.1 sugar transferase [Flavobacterium columnare]QOG58262.1 sugar transferase [Flavobacterium columnare]QOG60985.1 sugar transferase [Flavobacterium columnare]QOG63705.1 sugar transferase [Flavobacterium columnare]QOG66429.1 sugar transferase [Flavobacterium columnare]